MFMAILRQRAPQIPKLINPRLGDAVFANSAVAAGHRGQAGQNEIVALPLGGRVKIDPWSDELNLLKSAPVGNISERDKMPFEITPFLLYLTRQEAQAPKRLVAAAGVSDAFRRAVELAFASFGGTAIFVKIALP